MEWNDKDGYISDLRVTSTLLLHHEGDEGSTVFIDKP